MSWYLPLMRDGFICLAEHKFDQITTVCTIVRNGENCRMRLNDLLSDPDSLKVGQKDVSCNGPLSGGEIAAIWSAAAARKKSFG